MQSDIIQTNTNVYFLEMCVSIVRSNNLVSFMKSNFNIDIKNHKLIIEERPIFRIAFDDFYYLSFQKLVQVIKYEIHMIMDKICSKKDDINQKVVQLCKDMYLTVLSCIKSNRITNLLEGD